MATELEWQHRIEAWRDELPKHFYRPLGAVSLCGFTTTEQLTAAEAQERAFQPMPPGTAWGAKWEYGWFAGEVTVPEEAAGQRVMLHVDTGAESAIVIDGKNAGATDLRHHEITLAMHGEPGTRYAVLVESFAGNGTRIAHIGPTPLDRETVPEPPPTQAVVGESTFGVWQEDAYQLWLDVQTLWEIGENIDADSLRYAEIQQGLRDFTVIADFELPREEMLQTFRAARERLRPLLACTNGTTVPTLFTMGNSHIDVAWLWLLEETERKCARTFSTQLALMAEYPEYKFLQSQPHLFRMVKERYPELYARIKAAVKAGQIIPEGGMWVESDTNIISGESMIRQFVHGMRFFREEFGVECKVLWLPDVFGYSGAMPQILRGCGINYFSTAKILWAYQGGAQFPYVTFTWEGIDGSEVLAHLCYNYSAETNPASLIGRWKERAQKIGVSSRLFPFGYGDGGGGATRDHLEFLRRERDLEGVPRTQMGGLVDFFHDLEQRGIPDARYVGEIYYQAHRGVLTSQARIKLGNRKSEFALREAELWGAAARALTGLPFPYAEMDTAWKQVLLNQFHDIIPGSSIARVYEEAEAGYARVLETAEETAGTAAAQLTDDSAAMTVFNSLGWERTELTALPEEYTGAMGVNGESLPVQVVGDECLAEVTVPACGWTTMTPAAAGAEVANEFHVTDRLLENALLRITFNEQGEITSIFDKEIDRELAAGVCNNFRLYKDVPTRCDAWDIDSQYALTPVALPGTAVIEVVAAGPLVAILRVTRTLHDSTMMQEIRLRRGSRRVDFVTSIDWQERHKLLKVAFPVQIYANEAIHEIQFGHLRRPNHYSRQFDADRFEVSQHKWTALTEENRGCAVLNDSKYGVNVLGNSINLTLLKAALAPDMTADLGPQQFTYAFYAWNGSLADSGVVSEAYALNVPVMTVTGAAGVRSLFSVDAPNIVIETVKPAEDGSVDIIVRLYEAKRMATDCTLATTLPVQRAMQTNMLEVDQAPLTYENGNLPLSFRPFEVKTVRLCLD